MYTRDSRDQLIDKILADGESARFWAENCGWQPGTAYCRNHRIAECKNECSFRHLRQAETQRIIRGRQQRRHSDRNLDTRSLSQLITCLISNL
jgi:hypothetical protein